MFCFGNNIDTRAWLKLSYSYLDVAWSKLSYSCSYSYLDVAWSKLSYSYLDVVVTGKAIIFLGKVITFDKRETYHCPRELGPTVCNHETY